jgi:hypothetical protein
MEEAMRKKPTKIGGFTALADAKPGDELVAFLAAPQPEFLETSDEFESVSFEICASG